MTRLNTDRMKKFIQLNNKRLRLSFSFKHISLKTANEFILN